MENEDKMETDHGDTTEEVESLSGTDLSRHDDLIDEEKSSSSDDNEMTPSSVAHTPLMDEPGEPESGEEGYLSPDEDVTFNPSHRSSIKQSPYYSDHNSHYVTAQQFPDVSHVNSVLLPHSGGHDAEEEQLDYDEELPTTSNVIYSDDITPRKAVPEYPGNPLPPPSDQDDSSGSISSSSCSDSSDDNNGQGSSSEEGECESSLHSSAGSSVSEAEEGELPSKRRKSKRRLAHHRRKVPEPQESEAEEGECELSDVEPPENVTMNGADGDKTVQAISSVPLGTQEASEEAVDDDPWLKAVRQAKERLKKAKELKQNEKDVDEKKLNMNLLHVEEVNVPKPLAESKTAKLISGSVGAGSQIHGDGKLPLEDYLPSIPKKNDMLLEYYLYSIADQENWRFIGTDLNEVTEWQRQDYSEEWLKQFTRLTLGSKKASGTGENGEDYRKRRRQSGTSSVSSRSGSRSSSSSRSHSRGSSSSRSRSSSRSSAGNSSSSSSAVTSRSSSVSTSSSVSSIGHRRGRRMASRRRNNDRPDPATIYRSLHARTTLADLRHQTKPGVLPTRRSPPTRDHRSPSSERHNHHGYNQNRRAGNRPSPVYSRSGRKGAPVLTPDTTTPIGSSQGSVAEKKAIVSASTATIDPQLEARLSQWRAQPAPASGVDDQQWRDPWERRSRAAPTAVASQPSVLKPSESRSPVVPRVGPRGPSVSSSRSSSSNSSVDSRSSAFSGSSSASSSSTAASERSVSSPKRGSVKSDKDSATRRSVTAASDDRSDSGSSQSDSDSSSGSGSRSASADSRSSSSSASPRRTMDPKISGSTSATRRQLADSTVNISPATRLKLPTASDEHIVSSSTGEDKVRSNNRQEVKMHLPSKKRPLIMGRSAAQLEDEGEEIDQPRPPAPTLHIKSGLPLPVDTASLSITKSHPNPSTAQIEAAAAAISKSHEAIHSSAGEKKKIPEDRTRPSHHHDKQGAGTVSEDHRMITNRPSKHKQSTQSEDKQSKQLHSQNSREKHTKRPHDKTKHIVETKEVEKRPRRHSQGERDSLGKKNAVPNPERGRHLNSNQPPYQRHSREQRHNRPFPNGVPDAVFHSEPRRSFGNEHSQPLPSRSQHSQEFPRGNFSQDAYGKRTPYGPSYKEPFGRGASGEFHESNMNHPRGGENRRASGVDPNMGRYRNNDGSKYPSGNNPPHFGPNGNDAFRRAPPSSLADRTPTGGNRTKRSGGGHLEWREVPASSTSVMGLGAMDSSHKHRRHKDQEEFVARPASSSKIPTRTVHPAVPSRPGGDLHRSGRNDRETHSQSNATLAGSKRNREGAAVRAHSPERQSAISSNIPVKQADSANPNAGSEKKAVKRREELLQQLAMVEDAIAKKRAKMSGSSLIR